jgi:eukaryotic-like serine/threonine-protein kinase
VQSALDNGLADSLADAGVLNSRRHPLVAVAAQAELGLGTCLADTHRILGRVSGGGFGHVFLAEHVRHGGLAAVKTSLPGYAWSASVLVHEARVLEQLQHPNIVRVQHYGRDHEGGAYLVMDYAPGTELESWLEEHGSMPARRALGILTQLAAALDYMHERGFVHADLKPSHLIIDEARADALTLVDFGCAFEATDPVRSRDVGGTPGYMPLEQARGGRCTPAIDIYALAALASELLTGQLPHPHTTRSVLRALIMEPPALPSERGLLRPGLDLAFARALHEDPAARFTSASEFVRAVQESFA